MNMMDDGVMVCCLPDNAYCGADDEKRSPLDLDECPMGEGECSGDCYYYREDEEKYSLMEERKAENV